MSIFVGTIGLSSPAQLAARAISAADEMSERGARAKFLLRVDGKRRLRVSKPLDRKSDADGWVATFNKASDPDWLAEEIEGVSHG